MAKPKGWVKEPVRHGLAAKGVKTVTVRGLTYREDSGVMMAPLRKVAKADALEALHEELKDLNDEEEEISEELDHEEFLEKEGMSGDDMEAMLLEQDLERVRNEIIGVEKSIRAVMKGS